MNPTVYKYKTNSGSQFFPVNVMNLEYKEENMHNKI